MHANELLLHIMLFDFQDSKFSLHLRSEEAGSVSETIATVAEALWHHRTKLNATLARMRVEGKAQKISQLIPDPASRKIYESTSLCPCYARVNTIKVRDVQTEVINQLCNEGFMTTANERDLCKYSKSLCLLQRDLLAFSPDCREILDVHTLIVNGCLVPQVVTIIWCKK